jgi:large conductance mechanosensitive channel
MPTTFIKDFKKFAFKGNVIDLAIGVVIGTAFGRITNSLVKDILNPVLGVLVAGVDFTQQLYVLRPPKLNEDGQVIREAVVITYGNFIQALLDFLIVAFAIFIFVQILEYLRKREEKAAPANITPNNEKLLAEIRDLLKQQTEKQA